jgi:hypothetical protein
MTKRIEVQGERGGKLAWPSLSRSPQSPLHLNCDGKGTTFPLRSTNFWVTFFKKSLKVSRVS